MNKHIIRVLLLISSITSVSAAESKESKVTEIKSVEDYETLVTRSTTPVIIDFYAPWCEPCKKMSVIFERLAKEFGDKVRFVKINTDNAAVDSLVTQFSIRSIPTFVFKKGQSTSKRVAPVTEAELRKAIENLVAA